MTEFETSTHENDENIEIQEVEPKKKKFWWIFTIIILTIATIIGVAYFEICKSPYYGGWVFGDTEITVNANYNSKYNVIKIDLVADEIIEDWQVNASGGSVNGIKLGCETSDKSLKREFQFDDISLETGKKVETSLSIENAKLKDFVMVKDLLNGEVSIQYPRIISLDSTERVKLKQYYESGAWFFGLMWANALMGGY